MDSGASGTARTFKQLEVGDGTAFVIYWWKKKGRGNDERYREAAINGHGLNRDNLSELSGTCVEPGDP